MLNRILNRRSLAVVAVATAAATASIAGVGLAQDGGPKPAQQPTAPSGILADVHSALAGLVADGTIDQRAADAVQAEADAGSIDPKQLVDSGAVTDAQMHAVADVLDQVKRNG
jgi:hypothetical protein